MSDITPQASFETLKKNLLDSIQANFPYQGRKQSVVIENLRVDDNLSHDDIRTQAEAKDKEGTWGVPIKATVKLIDNATGKVVDTKKNAVLARVPKLTNRYGFIVNGSEYQVDHLFRLKSGAYARVQDNGDLETEFNLAKSPNGRGFSVKLDNKTKKFSLKLGTAHVPLYPVLKSMGVSDDQLEQQWGKDIYAANKPKNDEKIKNGLHKFWEHTVEEGTTPPNDVGDYAKHVHAFFDQTVIRPDTTAITLGKPFTKVNGEALSIAANKILGVAKGTHKPDDRDSLAFKEVVGVEDFLPERITRNAWTIKSRLRQTVDHKKTVSEVLTSDLFNRPIQDFFLKGWSLAERSDQTNPIQMLSAHRKTTLMSELGGIKNDNMLTTEMRVVNPSHIGFLDPMHTPESERTGITLYMGAGVRKNGKDLETPVYDLKSGKLSYAKVPDFHHAVAVLPDQVRWVNGKPVPISDKVKVKLPGGDIELRPFKEAQYVMPSAKGMFNYSSNLIPFLPTDQGNRVSMADKQMEQAISLKHREAPMVQSKTDSKDSEHTFEKFVGHFTATKSPVDGKVIDVKKDAIVLQTKEGKKEIQVYNHFPLNDPKGMMHSEVAVKPGDSVKAGQLLADTNYTKNGALAIGTNLRIGYIPYKGYNFEDGIVISETAAKKLTSEHLHKMDLEIDPSNDFISKEKFKAHSVVRASQMSKEQWDNLDDSGIIKPGTVIKPGQVLVAAVGKNMTANRHFAAMGKRAISPFKDKSLVWDGDHVGVVTKVVPNPNGKGVKVYVKTEEQAVIGDKLSGRHGNKGIITQILPDHEMPHTIDQKTGEKRPLEVLLNPSGVPTRINVGQMLETAAGKIAEKTGKPYIVNNFAGPDHDYRKQVVEDLKKHGISDTEHVYDPKDTRRPLGEVLVGPQFLMKLKHQVEKKLTVRGGGTNVENRPLAYDVDKQPVKGGEKGGQGFGQLDMYALLGHDARHNIREMSTYKSDMQDTTFWNMVQQGHEPPPPKIPFTYQKFEGLLKGLGVNVEKTGTSIRLLPMTTQEVLKMAGNGKNEIKDAGKALRAKDLKEEVGGLFDPVATGGKDGDKWSYIKLHEPMPNPIFCGEATRPGPVPVLLGLKRDELDHIMQGKATLEGKTGGAAIEHALKKVNVDAEISKTKAELPNLKGTELDRANRKMKMLLALKETGLKPHEAYILHAVPVVPPKFRPVIATPTGDVNYAPINGLYKNISLINQELQTFDPKVFSADKKHNLNKQMWDAMKALQSVGKYDPVYDSDKSGNRELKGILDTIGSADGQQPKEGFFQSKLIKRRQNLSIRSTIVPEPALGIDEVGLPKNAAMELYKPFVVAQLHRWSIDPLAAQQEIKKGTDLAFKALSKVVEDRPLLLKRDPVLHKFSVMAFKPKLVEGKAIQIHPLVTGGFNADFDGDTMAGTVPMSREAVEEAKKLFPSNNLFSPTSGKVMYAPNQEALLGLHLLSKWGKNSGKTFENINDLKKAVDSHQLEMTDVVKLKGAKAETTLGRLLIAEKMPPGFGKNVDILHDPGFEITKGSLGGLADKMAREHTPHFAKSINALKDLGNEHSFKFGFSFGLKDLEPLKARDGILADAHKQADAVKKSSLPAAERDKKLVQIYSDATKKIDVAAREQLKGNRLATMVYSGARGSPDQLRQMIAAPMLMQDSMNRTIPMPVTRSYAEGLDIGDYWLAQHGARKGTLQRAMGTSEPGAISKDIINSTMSTLITSNDCGTKQGVLMDLTHKDVHDRFTAAPYKLKDGTVVHEGTLLSPDVTSRLKNSKHDKVLVRSPLKCEHGDGICAKCFGLNENGRTHHVGTNIGVLAGQALGEPAVQMAMDAFHSGGIASSDRGAKSVDRFTRLRNLLEMPKTLRDQATMANVSGKITNVVHHSTGADVHIGDVKHFVPKHLVLDEIKPGVEVKKGDKLSDGYVNPHALLNATKDIHAVQNYLVKEMYDGLYEKEGVRRRNVEVAVRALTNLTRVKDPGNSHFIHGDVLPRYMVEEHNRSLPKGKAPVQHEPILRGIQQVPASISDWMTRLNYQQLHTSIQQAAHQGLKADLHGSSPIPGIAMGSEFGKAPATKPKHVY